MSWSYKVAARRMLAPYAVKSDKVQRRRELKLAAYLEGKKGKGLEHRLIAVDGRNDRPPKKSQWTDWQCIVTVGELVVFVVSRSKW